MTKVHTLPTGTMAQHETAAPTKAAAPAHIPAPDLLEIISIATPGQDGVSILYSLAGGLDFRIARLAALITNSMASHVFANGGVDKFNEAFQILDEQKSRAAAFYATGLDQPDMMEDLKGLLGFRATVAEKIEDLTSKHFATRWHETIARAAEPREVEEWKLADGWAEYVEACHGKPEMTEEEHREMEKAELSGKKQNWVSFMPQIIDTIEEASGEPIAFDELNVKTQNTLLASISSDEKEQTLRKNAKKMARSPSELHTRRVLISDFICKTREALKHSRYATL